MKRLLGEGGASRTKYTEVLTPSLNRKLPKIRLKRRFFGLRAPFSMCLPLRGSVALHRLTAAGFRTCRWPRPVTLDGFRECVREGFWRSLSNLIYGFAICCR